MGAEVLLLVFDAPPSAFEEGIVAAGPFGEPVRPGGLPGPEEGP